MPKETPAPMTSREIDAALAVLSALRLTPVTGWTSRELAEIIGCSPAAIERRTAKALLAAKRKLPADLHPNK